MDLIERHRPALEEICAKHHLLLDEEVISQRRDRYIQKGRCECYCFLRHKGFSYEYIARAFNRNHAAIIYTIKTHCDYKELVKNL